MIDSIQTDSKVQQRNAAWMSFDNLRSGRNRNKSTNTYNAQPVEI